MTYSLESAFVRACSVVAVGVQGLLDTAGTLERITRPPRRPWADLDTPLDGAEQLAACDDDRPLDWREEVSADGGSTWRPRAGAGSFECMACGARYSKAGDHECPRLGGLDPAVVDPRFVQHSDTTNPTEPSLTDDELVAVRGLIQERYEPRPAPPDDLAVRLAQARKKADTQNTSAASAAGDQVPGGLRHSPPPPSGERPDLATWLEPAVLTILDEHMPFMDSARDDFCDCGEYIDDSDGWQQHVAPLMSAHIAKAVEADWLPQHTKPQR